MPNATVRANARPMSEATNRRAILGAIVTAGAAIGLPAALATAAAAAPTLSPVDKRVEHLWLRRRRLKAIAGHLNKQHKAAADSLPAWAQAGPDLVFGDRDAGRGEGILGMAPGRRSEPQARVPIRGGQREARRERHCHRMA